MPLTLENYESVLSKELLKAAEKCPVRECDEIEKGVLIAYVDEGKESFDVSLTIERNMEISANSCDCKNGAKFCRHKAALLMHIAKGKNKKSNSTGKIKKTTKADLLLETVELPDLKLWLSDLLAKNKDTELAFIHYFSPKNRVHTPEEVSQITNDVIKAVVKNKKNIDPTELKKIIDLWTKVHKPIVEHYHANIADEKSFLNFHTLIECCRLFHSKIKINSNKILKYVEELLQQSAESINNLQDETSWIRAVKFFTLQLPADAYNIRIHYLLHLRNLFNVSTETRKNELVNLLVDQYKQCKATQRSNGDEFSKVLFELVELHGVFAEHYNIFKPQHYNNDFNEKLIRGLIDIGKLDLAIKYCDEQILNNFRQEYNLPYLQLLKEIYKAKNDHRNLAKVLATLFPFTYCYDDYLFISNRITDETEKKNWHQKMFIKARRASSNYDRRATDFCFALLDKEKNYKKMINIIDSYTPYEIIYRYFEPMVLTDKSLLLKAIVDKSESYSWRFTNSEKDTASFPALLEELLKHYPADYLKKVITHASH